MTPAPQQLDHLLLPEEEQRSARRAALVSELQRRPASSRAGVRRRRGMRAALALSAVAAVVAVATVGVPSGGGGGGLDVVAQAHAALTAPGEIMHVRVRVDPGRYGGLATIVDGPGGRVIGRATGVIERWTTTGPWRERTTTLVAPAGGGPPLTQQMDYGAGVVRSYNSSKGTIDAHRLTEPQREAYERSARPAGPPSLQAAGVAGDPVAAIRRLLDDGTLRADGRREIRGRDVLRLVGAATTNATADGSTAPISYEYLVAASSHVPVQITWTELLAARPGDPEPAARHDRSVVTRLIFEKFERIALTDETKGLLRIDTTV